MRAKNHSPFFLPQAFDLLTGEQGVDPKLLTYNYFFIVDCFIQFTWKTSGGPFWELMANNDDGFSGYCEDHTDLAANEEAKQARKAKEMQRKQGPQKYRPEGRNARGHRLEPWPPPWRTDPTTNLQHAFNIVQAMQLN